MVKSLCIGYVCENNKTSFAEFPRSDLCGDAVFERDGVARRVGAVTICPLDDGNENPALRHTIVTLNDLVIKLLFRERLTALQICVDSAVPN